MNLSLAISVAVMIVGLVLYLVATPPRPNEIGRLMFVTGLLVTLLRTAAHVMIS